MEHRGSCRSARFAVLAVGLLAGCGDAFSTGSPDDGGTGAAGGAGAGGSTGSGGRGAGGRAGSGGRTGAGGLPSSGGLPGAGGFVGTGGGNSSGGRASSGGAVGSGGVTASGGAPDSGGTTSSGGTAAAGGTPGSGGTMASGGANTSGGTPGSGGSGGCGPLTLLNFVDGGFESGAPVDEPPGWEGAPNPPYYAALSSGAARTGSRGVEFNDTGSGTPGIQQKIPVPPEALGRTVTVTAWFRIVTFPSMRLLVEANSASGLHLAIPFEDTDPAVPGFQQLSVSLTIPPATDHLMVKLIGAVAPADGVAHADDVQVCVDGMCSPCPVAIP